MKNRKNWIVQLAKQFSLPLDVPYSLLDISEIISLTQQCVSCSAYDPIVLIMRCSSKCCV